MSIKITGMYSGLDTESIISELVSAQSVKKSKLVKAQTKHSWKQDAWKALNTKIFDFYTNTLSNMRYQSSYTKKTTKISNTNAIKVITGDNAVDGVRSLNVDQLAKGATLTSVNLVRKDDVYFGEAATLSQLRKFSDLDNSANLSGSFRAVGAQGQYFDFEVNENTTISDVVDMIRSTGLNANFDQESQRIFIGSKNTGAANDFNLVANNEGGLNALAALGLLSASGIKSDNPDKPTEYQVWAGYADDHDAYSEVVADEIEKRKAAYKEANENLTAENEKLQKETDELKTDNKRFFDSMDNGDYFAIQFRIKYGGEQLKDFSDKLYGDNGLFDDMQAKQKTLDEVKANEASTQAEIDAAQADYDNAKSQYDEANKKIIGLLEDIAYGPLVEQKDDEGNTVYEKVQKTDSDGNPLYEQVEKKDEEGNTVKDEEGNTVYENGDPIYEDKPVMVRKGGLDKEYEEAMADGGTVPPAIQTRVDSVNKWYNAIVSLEANKSTIVSNEAAIAANSAQIADNSQYLEEEGDGVDNMTMSKLEAKVREDFDAKINISKVALEAVEGNNAYSNLLGASKVDAQDAELTIDGAKFTSMTNTFNINGMTITALETTDKEVTMTTSTDTDGIYDMIKNFFTEYNKLINEMDSLYNAESSKGYEPLTSEEKDAMSDSEIEEWEKKIKDSLLRRDSTLSSVSFSMASVLLQGAEVNGIQMYLSDFGINTLGYFKAAENERNAYHINGDPDDADTKAEEDVLKAMIANDPDTVMNFFSKLSTNLYDKLTTQMASTTLSSAFTVYNDKLMKTEYDSYKNKIAKEEEKLNDLMDKWYKKFSAMEVAMSKLESRSNSLTSILGG